MCNFTEFVSTNSAFILTFTGLLGSCCTATLVYILKSRCTAIKCCGFSCERQPIPAAELQNVAIAQRNDNLPV